MLPQKRLQSPDNPLPPFGFSVSFFSFFIPYTRDYNIIIMLPQKRLQSPVNPLPPLVLVFFFFF